MTRVSLSPDQQKALRAAFLFGGPDRVRAEVAQIRGTDGNDYRVIVARDEVRLDVGVGAVECT